MDCERDPKGTSRLEALVLVCVPLMALLVWTKLGNSASLENEGLCSPADGMESKKRRRTEGRRCQLCVFDGINCRFAFFSCVEIYIYHHFSALSCVFFLHIFCLCLKCCF